MWVRRSFAEADREADAEADASADRETEADAEADASADGKADSQAGAQIHTGGDPSSNVEPGRNCPPAGDSGANFSRR